MKNQFIVGTSSSAGKHTIASMFLNMSKKRGNRVTPFKPISIDLCGHNDRLCESVYYQCAISGGKPTVSMNPIRVKYATGINEPVFYVGSKRFGHEEFRSNFTEQGLKLVLEEHISKLCSNGAVVIGEGSGNPTDGLGHEVAQSESIRVLDADVHIVCGELNGGVFASIVGTIELLPPDIRKRIKSIFINRFNHPISFKILDEFGEFSRERFGISSIIVIPTFESLKHNKEDVPFDPKSTKDIREEIAFLSEITASSSPEFASLFR